jgi:hypothetical protein
MKTFAYKIIFASESDWLISRLDKLGAEGWELVSVTFQPSGTSEPYKLFFKRTDPNGL